VQLLNDHEGIPQTSNIILGSMFMQSFQMLFFTEYAENPHPHGIALDVSKHGYGASISSSVPSNNATGIFDYAIVRPLPLFCSNETMFCSLYAELGFQGYGPYLVSFTDSTLYTLSADCVNNATNGTCSQNQYFNTNSTYGRPVDSHVHIESADGLSTTVMEWDQIACMYYGPEDEFPYCTPQNVDFYVGLKVNSDAWNFGSSNASGIFGFAPGSPIYSTINPLIG